jgi:type VI secretion system protein ImpF
MAQISSNKPLLPSVLDRLIDHSPQNTREPHRDQNQVLRELKQSVARDLENLLNTRYRAKPLPKGLDELEVSLVNYGIPDFTGASLGVAQERDKFRSIIERVLRVYEPRFKTVKVQIVPNQEPTDRTLRFRIDALLYADPAPEPVVFDSQLDPTSATFEVKKSVR